MNFPNNCAECKYTDTCLSFHYGDEDCKYRKEIEESINKLMNKT